jgi:DNA-binding CsgD family transcriptional regulator
MLYCPRARGLHWLNLMMDRTSSPTGLTARTFRLGDVGDVLLVSFPLERAARLGLTPAERAVVALAVAGATNAEIARTRSASERTVCNQLTRAFRKLSVGSRAELAERFARVDWSAEDAA